MQTCTFIMLCTMSWLWVCMYPLPLCRCHQSCLFKSNGLDGSSRLTRKSSLISSWMFVTSQRNIVRVSNLSCSHWSSVQTWVFIKFVVVAAAEAPRCFVCNARAECLCKQCASEVNKDGYLCSLCNKQFHTHPSRINHVPDRSVSGGMVDSILDLLSVICIETSHYVCFTKELTDDPNKPPRWIFFDSMANRVCKFDILLLKHAGLKSWVSVW